MYQLIGIINDERVPGLENILAKITQQQTNIIIT